MTPSDTHTRAAESAFTGEFGELAATRTVRRLPLNRVRLGAVLALAIAAGFVVWAAIGLGGGSHKAGPAGPVAKGVGPVALNSQGLLTLARVIPQPIYWLGARPNNFYELTRTRDGKVYVRYLPSGVAAGDKRPFLTVGTYPVPNAFSLAKSAARKEPSIRMGGNGVAVYSPNNVHSVYIAFPGSAYQIEVYSPTPRLARQLVAANEVSAVSTAISPRR